MCRRGSRRMSFDSLKDLRAIADAECGPRFFLWPDRWWETPHWRCENDHVSTHLLLSERLGRDACLACKGAVHLTFPEDVDGPLVYPEIPFCPFPISHKRSELLLSRYTAQFQEECPEIVGYVRFILSQEESKVDISNPPSLREYVLRSKTMLEEGTLAI